MTTVCQQKCLYNSTQTLYLNSSHNHQPCSDCSANTQHSVERSHPRHQRAPNSLLTPLRACPNYSWSLQEWPGGLRKPLGYLLAPTRPWPGRTIAHLSMVSRPGTLSGVKLPNLFSFFAFLQLDNTPPHYIIIILYCKVVITVRCNIVVNITPNF